MGRGSNICASGLQGLGPNRSISQIFDISALLCCFSGEVPFVMAFLVSSTKIGLLLRLEIRLRSGKTHPDDESSLCARVQRAYSGESAEVLLLPLSSLSTLCSSQDNELKHSSMSRSCTENSCSWETVCTRVIANKAWAAWRTHNTIVSLSIDLKKVLSNT